MKKSYVDSIALSADAFQSRLPAKPDANIRQIVNRTILALPQYTRGHYLLPAVAILLLGLASLIAAAVVSSFGFAFLGALGVFGGVLCAIAVLPARVEAAIATTQHQADLVLKTHAGDCDRAAAEFNAQQRSRLSELISGAIASGASLDHVRAECAVLEENERQRRQALEAKRDADVAEASRCETEYRRIRDRQASFFRLGRARVLPWQIRREARDALLALAKWYEASARVREIQTQLFVASEAQATVAALGQPPEVTFAPEREEQLLPPWRGIALPPPEEIRESAIAVTRTKLSDIRATVLQAAAEKQAPAAAAMEALRDLLAEQPPWPEKLSAYLSGLNGELPSILDTLLASGSEWLPANRAAGRKRHRKVFLFGDDVANSPVIGALRERLPDTAGVVGIENPPEELLLVMEEHNLSLSEIPEALACLASFRSASAARQDSLILSLESTHDIRDYFPDRGNAAQSAEQLWAVALVLGVLQRGKDHRYRLDDKIVARGFEDVIALLEGDRRFAEAIGTRLELAITSSGVARVTQQLAAARAAPDSVVPSEAHDAFLDGLDQAMSDLYRN